MGRSGMKAHALAAEKRDVLGKKVKQLRKKGLVPGNIYGKSVKSAAISLSLVDLKKVYGETGETGLIEITVKGAKEPHHVLVHNIQRHAVSGDFIHVDLHEVALKEKITIPVPVKFVGDAPALTAQKGVLITILNELEVEALPTDLPEEIEVELVSLKEVGDAVKVSDIKTSAKFKIIQAADTVIARINPLQKEEAPAPAAVEVPVEGAETAKPEQKAENAPATPAKAEEKK